MEFLSVDRIEKDYLICENQDCEIQIIQFKNSNSSLKEGSIIYFDDSGNLNIDEEKTLLRRKNIIELNNKILKNHKKQSN